MPASAGEVVRLALEVPAGRYATSELEAIAAEGYLIPSFDFAMNSADRLQMDISSFGMAL